VVECFEKSDDSGSAATELLAAVREFVQAELRDDIAVLVIGICGTPEARQHTSGV